MNKLLTKLKGEQMNYQKLKIQLNDSEVLLLTFMLRFGVLGVSHNKQKYKIRLGEFCIFGKRLPFPLLAETLILI